MTSAAPWRHSERSDGSECLKPAARPLFSLPILLLFWDWTVNQVREAEIGIDTTIGPVEESFALLNKHELLFNDGNAERVDGLTYAWKNLNALVRRCGQERAPDLNAKR